jgi:multisubunit Na+/H+ antiporter MnhB subunit
MSLSAIILHPARRLLVPSFIVALPLCIVGSVCRGGHALPGIALVPLGLTALLTILVNIVYRPDSSNAVKERDYRPAAVMVFFCDILSVVALLVMLVLCYTTVNRSYHYWLSTSETWVVSYATVPMLFNFFVQLYLALLMSLDLFGLWGLMGRLFPGPRTTCPHCHETLQPSYAPHFSFARDGSQPVQTRDADRFHDDDTTAALLDPSNDNQTVEVNKGKATV